MKERRLEQESVTHGNQVQLDRGRPWSEKRKAADLTYCISIQSGRTCEYPNTEKQNGHDLAKL